MPAPEYAAVIIGAGPAGCTLAALLSLRGLRCLVFDDDKRPDLLVGESLIPGVVPIFQRLRIEERVAAISVRKPGASFFVTDGGPRIHFSFTNVAGQLPTYAFNSPRPELDNLLRRRAEELGATFVTARAEIEAQQCDGKSSVRLSDASCAVAGIDPTNQPLLVDASGRARVFSRAMELPAKRGGRDDVAHFAHFENASHDEVPPGQVIISVLRAGWAWRIPLPGRVSVGIVVSKGHARTLGATAEERLEAAIHSEPMLSQACAQARRVTPVMTYVNYQLLSEQGYGPGWVLAGDAFGFVDPMLSPGLFLSLEGARLLDHHLFSKGRQILEQPAALEAALARYSAEVVRWHRAWSELVRYFYDGRIFQMHLAGRNVSEKPSPFEIAKVMERHTTRHLASMASGGSTRGAYSRALIRFLATHLVWGVPAASEFAVRDLATEIPFPPAGGVLSAV